MRSHFLCTVADFKARKSEQLPESQVYQRTHPTDVSTSLPAIQCQVLIQTPELFAMDASDVACFLIICSQTDVDFQMLSRFHLIAMLMVTDYFQMDTVAALLFRHYVKMTNVLHDPLTLLNALLHIFGPGHPYCDQLTRRMARVLDIPPSKITDLMRHREDPLLFTTTRFRKLVRDRLRATQYYSRFRTFTCEDCHLDLRCKPIARYVYDLARCWPCCGSLIHIACMPPLCKLKRCPYCGMAFYFGEPQWERQSPDTRYRVRFIHRANGISLTEALPRLSHSRHTFL